jgi:hypothetical protein
VSASPEGGGASPRGLVALYLLYGGGLLAFSRARRREAREDAHGRQLSLFAAVLGARHVAEAILLGRGATPRRVLASASVDALHAASMLVLARISPAWRRPALASAAAAGLLCTYAVRCARRAR